MRPTFKGKEGREREGEREGKEKGKGEEVEIGGRRRHCLARPLA